MLIIDTFLWPLVYAKQIPFETKCHYGSKEQCHKEINIQTSSYLYFKQGPTIVCLGTVG